MEKTRTQNAKRNILTGILNRIIILGLPFIIRSIIIWRLGAEYLGLSGLFTSILQVLNMTELGISSCIIFGLYKPIAENDTDSICALLSLYKKIYHIIGSIIFFIGIILLPFLKYLIKGDYPKEINLYFLYLLFLFNTVISYFLFAYKSAILIANQRQDLINNVESILTILKSGFQIVLLLVLKNFYVYIICNLVYTVVYNIYIAYLSKKYFPSYICRGIVSNDKKKEMIKQIKGLAIGKLNVVSRNSFDSIVLSMFCGLLDVAIYSNYFYVFSSISGFISLIINSISAGIGNTIVTKNKEQIFQDYKKFNFYMSWIFGWCTICLYCLYQPFMELWVGKELTSSNLVMILFCIYFYICQMGQMRSAYSNAMGVWWEVRKTSLFEMISNFVLNFILGYYFGMVGILFATIITIFLFSIIWNTCIIFPVCFEKSAALYFKDYIFFAFETIILSLITKFICNLIQINSFSSLLLIGIICVFVPNFLLIFFARMNKLYWGYLKEGFGKYLWKK